MEFGHQVGCHPRRWLTLACFNPYCYGIWSSGSLKTLTLPISPCFNPYCYGIWSSGNLFKSVWCLQYSFQSLLLWNLVIRIHPELLNRLNQLVSILIVMEFGHQVRWIMIDYFWITGFNPYCYGIWSSGPLFPEIYSVIIFKKKSCCFIFFVLCNILLFFLMFFIIFAYDFLCNYLIFKEQ